MRSEKLPEGLRYSAALYMRLSKDDEGAGESASIITQRKMLRAYAKENEYTVYDEYVDDGISGTTFERPNFKRMIQDIESKKVNMVITKDLSRLGRDYILAGQYTEIYFPSKKVRYIAINDGYDSESPYTDIAPFKNVINEMYARDTSKKIRSAFTTRMQEGAFVGAFAPYGYQRDPTDKHHLVKDAIPGKIVQEIFQKAAEGVLPVHIARGLNYQNVPTPMEYRYMHNPAMNTDDFLKRREWTSATITKMLRNIVYLGHMAQGKTTKISFKSDVTVANPEEDWFVVENTHEPLVSRETFNLAARRSKQRSCVPKGNFSNIFSGIARCAACGRGMSTVGTRKKGATANLTCGGYKLYGSQKCSNHFIDYDALYQIVLDSIQESVKLSKQDEQEILERAKKEIRKKNIRPDRNKDLTALKKRSRELDCLVGKLYEDHIAGVLNAERMKRLLQKYEAESAGIAAQLAGLEQEPYPLLQENQENKLTNLLYGFTAPEELKQELLYRLIDHIEIGQGYFEKTEQGQCKRQSIKIYYRFAGAAAVKKYII